VWQRGFDGGGNRKYNNTYQYEEKMKTPVQVMKVRI
jgi:hypothetical protein